MTDLGASHAIPVGVSEADWEALNALADDEVPRREAACLRARLGSEPAMTEAFASIERAKRDARTWDRRPSDHDPAVRRRDRRSIDPRAWLVAMGLGGLALGAAAATAVLISAPTAKPFVGGDTKTIISAEATALAWHRAMTDRGGPVSQGIARLAKLVPLDLSEDGLRLSREAVATGPGGPLAVRHYRGLNGCRLTHLVGAVPPSSREDENGDGVAVRRWRADDLAHVLVAEGMDGARFAALADHAERLTRSGAGTGIRMADARLGRGRPCTT